jgi:2-phospho-L-lactate guanylyltransferase
MAAGVWAVIPVKRLSLAKSRLSTICSPRFRRALVLAMFEDVADTLQRTRELAGVAVVSDDPVVVALSRRLGLRIFDEPADPSRMPAGAAGSGQNAALASVARVLRQEGARAMLAISADVPGVSASEVRCVLEAGPARCGADQARTSVGHGRYFVVAEAHDGSGSNAVLASPPDVLSTAFGPDSRARHLRAALDAGVPACGLRLPGLAHDIDLPGDVVSFANRCSTGRTARLLAPRPFGTGRVDGGWDPGRVAGVRSVCPQSLE